jgi:hypothetical protein
MDWFASFDKEDFYHTRAGVQEVRHKCRYCCYNHLGLGILSLFKMAQKAMQIYP